MKAAVGPGAKMGLANPESKNKGAGNAARGSAVQVPLTSTWQPAWGVAGVDVSSWQASNGIDNVNWAGLWNQGVRFAYVKATEGNYFTSPTWGQQYTNSQTVGMIRGSYHFAIPNWSSGADQAAYFVNNGGGWSSDGITMPPVLDIEYNPYAGRTINGVYMGNTCYDLSPAQMTQWISDFSNTMATLTGRRPVIYSTTDWWSSCTGNSGAFTNNPLWIAAYNTSGPGGLPASWSTFSIWQYSSDGPFPGDSNIWNGDYTGLQRFATYADAVPTAEMTAAANSAGLGSATGGVVCGLKDGGCYQLFQNGAVLWSQTTGAQASPYGPIRDAWASTGFESGTLGYPTSGVVCGLKDGGCYQMFQNGAVIWSQSTGAQVTANGPIRDAWGRSGYESGTLGYPTSGVVCGLKDGGCYQMFQKGAILWSQSTGAQVSPSGPLRDAWGRTGYESGALGYPTSGVVCGLKDGGCYQMFQKGAILWSQSTGAQVTLNGPLRDAWGRTGYESGTLGYPTSGVVCGLKDGGCYQMFQNGAIIWSQSTGAQVSPSGPLRDVWARNGYESGALGYPTSGVVCGLKDGGCYQMFQNGATINSAASPGSSSLVGAVRSAWGAAGYQNGSYGFPTSDDTCTPGVTSCSQSFQGGTISWDAQSGIKQQ